MIFAGVDFCARFIARQCRILFSCLLSSIFEKVHVPAQPSPRTSQHSPLFLNIGAKQQTTYADYSVISSAGAEKPCIVDKWVLEERAEQTHVFNFSNFW